MGFLQGCGGGSNTVEYDEIECEMVADGCHADLDCRDDGFMQYTIHNCPDFTGQGGRTDGSTCEEFAADLELADSCKKAMVCCVASGDNVSDPACIRNAVCTNSSQAVQKLMAV